MERSETVGHLTAQKCGASPDGRSPLIVLRVLVSLLHCRFLFGGLGFVWQQHEGDVAVHCIFTLGQQTSVHQKMQQEYLMLLPFVKTL